MMRIETNEGQCHDCSNNKYIIKEPFVWYSEDGNVDNGFWYCTYCGSSNVDVPIGVDGYGKKNQSMVG
jgi:hypothetical protein